MSRHSIITFHILIGMMLIQACSGEEPATQSRIIMSDQDDSKRVLVIELSDDQPEYDPKREANPALVSIILQHRLPSGDWEDIKELQVEDIGARDQMHSTTRPGWVIGVGDDYNPQNDTISLHMAADFSLGRGNIISTFWTYWHLPLNRESQLIGFSLSADESLEELRQRDH